LPCLHDRSVVPFLIKALSDSYEKVRKEAARALGYLGDTSAAPHLIEALSDPHGDVRREAAAALGDLANKCAVPALTKALSDPDGDVRADSAYALSRCSDAGCIRSLLASFCLLRVRSSLWQSGKVMPANYLPPCN